MKRLLLTLCALLCSFASQAAIIESGHTGVWRNVERSGEGVTLEILSATSASMVWFTYDEQGKPRWAYGLGTIIRGEDERIEFPDLFRSTGGRFNAAYAPSTVNIERVGKATLRFVDCNEGEFVFEAFGQVLEIEQLRLTQVMAAGCTPPHGTPGDRILSYAGQSGVWNDPNRFGQGLQLQWTADNAPGIGWYTFDANGNQYWLTGLGRLEGEPSDDGRSRIVIPMLYAPRGARFGNAFDPDDVELVQWGSAELELTCDRGVLRWNSVLPEFGSGEREIRLLTRSVPAACPWVKPKLSDLYDISFTPVPIPAPTSLSNRNAIEAEDMADDGTVVGTQLIDGNFAVVRLKPGEDQWQLLSDFNFLDRVFISPDGRRIVATRNLGLPRSEVVVHQDGSGWQLLSGRLGLGLEIAYGVSGDRNYVLGEGRYDTQIANSPWLWSEPFGQRLLPVSSSIPGGTPLEASNDGSTVIGVTLRQQGVLPRTAAIRWHQNQPPEILRDSTGVELSIPSACSSDCSIIFGSDQSLVDETHPNARQGWFWKSPSESAYLGLPNDIVVSSYQPITVTDTSADGSIAIGAYETTGFRTEAFIWTQSTGSVSVASLLAELGVTDVWTVRIAKSISSDGSQILLGGYRSNPPNPLIVYKAGVIRFSEKSSSR